MLLDEDLVAQDAYYYTSWVLTVLTVLIVVICIAMRNKIRCGNFDIILIWGASFNSRGVYPRCSTPRRTETLYCWGPMSISMLIGACNPMLCPNRG